jgi:hypothetical protein
LLALRLRSALHTLVRMVMRMLVWLLPLLAGRSLLLRRRCAAALREGGYRRRQDEAREARVEERAILLALIMLPPRNGRPNVVLPC